MKTARKIHKRVPLAGRNSFFDRFASRVTHHAGSPAAFVIAVVTILVWAATGPIFGFSDTWQIVVNTGTTIVTFLMVFIIQQSQNKDSEAVHLKLNELLISQRGASNHLVSIEELDQCDLDTLKRFYARLARLAQEHGAIEVTHSLERAEKRSQRKSRPGMDPDIARSGLHTVRTRRSGASR